MIDWNKPIETVPCERNPKPVPCRLVELSRDAAEVKIMDDWYCVDLEDQTLRDNQHIGGWLYEVDGTNVSDWLPKLRNVA